MLTPVLFLIFNRPDLTATVFERIKEYRPTKLYIAADGPRLEKEGETIQCALSRKATEGIDWPCEVHRLYRPKNLGCKKAVSSAITWLFDHEPVGIILEDDCLPSVSFFHFCSELLERFKARDDMGIIGGNCPVSFARDPDESYYFSKYPHIWGWATWRKVWQHYDVDLNSWNGSEASLLKQIPNRTTRKYWTRIFNLVKDGKIDTWDYQLAHLCLASNRFSISPTINLVENIGFDERATHTITRDLSKPKAVGREFHLPLSHPIRIEVNEKLDLLDEKQSFGICRSHVRLFYRGVRSNVQSVATLFINLLKSK